MGLVIKGLTLATGNSNGFWCPNVDQNICSGGFSADLFVVADVMILEKRSKSSELVVTFKGETISTKVDEKNLKNINRA